MCTGAELLLIGSGVSAVGQIAGTQAQSEALQRNAELERIKGASEKASLMESAERLRGQQRVAAAKSGVSQGGSVFEVMRQSAEDVEREAINIEFGAEAGSQSKLFEAKQVKKAGLVGAGGTLLSGVGTFKNA